jgi:hypothetical protein
LRLCARFFFARPGSNDESVLELLIDFVPLNATI